MSPPQEIQSAGMTTHKTNCETHMAIKYKVMHAEKYTSDGQEKTRWTQCGVVMSNRNGGFALKMEVVPINSTGWFNLFVPDDKKKEEAPRSAPATNPEPDDALPF